MSAEQTRATYAADPARSKGREFPLAEGGVRGPRSAFQRDRDRVIHSIAFRRLRSKTQVFIAPDGDHYRTRLTHSLEVAQIGRVLARALGLDEDLTEALCLAHDIGHPPFGHAGETALNDALEDTGGFDHNEQALKTLMRLDSPYIEHPGLNLTWEMLSGTAKHNGPVAAPGVVLTQLNADYDLALESWPSLEAQIAALADDIAYDNHDIDDGLRAGIIGFDALMGVPGIAQQFEAVARAYPDAPQDKQVKELVRGQIGLMVNDVIAATKANIAASGAETVDDVRAAGRALASFSPEMAREERTLKAFLYNNLYNAPDQREIAKTAHRLVARLHAGFCQAPEYLPESWQAALPADEAARSRYIGDYIAGMTDRYAIDQYALMFGAAPGGLSNV